ncbi:MAG: hypothetical protein HOV78_32395, partial [Hamadaea sp.]|nr:hypothetical protein [Hamadaea sp.]
FYGWMLAAPSSARDAAPTAEPAAPTAEPVAPTAEPAAPTAGPAVATAEPAVARAEPAGAGELLAAAWHRWRDRLVGAHRRHPWPPWMAGDDLVATLLRMSGDAAEPSTVERGREIADLVAEPVPDESTVDLRSALEEAAAARHELFELRGHVFGLERTLGYRDKQLKVREKRIREMRASVQRYEAIRNHRLFKYVRYAAKIRHPKQFARAVMRRLRG